MTASLIIRDPTHIDVRPDEVRLCDVTSDGEDWTLTYTCRAGCVDRDGRPARHTHPGGKLRDGGPLSGGATSHCPRDPAWYWIEPKTDH